MKNLFNRNNTLADFELCQNNIFKYNVFAPMGRFQLELIYLYFPPSFHLTVFFLSCRPFVVNTTFSTGLVGVEVTSVSWLGQLTEFKITDYCNYWFLKNFDVSEQPKYTPISMNRLTGKKAKTILQKNSHQA